MKKLFSVMLSVFLVTAMAVAPITAGAAYVSGDAIFDMFKTDFASFVQSATATYHTSETATATGNQGGLIGDGTTWVFAEGNNINPVEKIDSFNGRQNVLHLGPNLYSGSYQKGDLSFVREGLKSSLAVGDRARWATGLYIPSPEGGAALSKGIHSIGLFLAVMTVETLQDNYPAATWSIMYEGLNASDLILCVYHGNASTGFCKPVCKFTMDEWHDIELSFTLTATNAITPLSFRYDGELISTFMTGASIQTKVGGGYWTDTNFGYAAYGTSGNVIAIAAGSTTPNYYFSNMLFEKIVEQPLTLDSITLNGTEPADYDSTANALPSASGVIAAHFSEAPNSVEVTMTETVGDTTYTGRVAPEGTLSGTDYTINLQDAPLHPGSVYTLTFTSGTATESVTFTAAYDGYYINENFESYANVNVASTTAVDKYPYVNGSGHNGMTNQIFNVAGDRNYLQMKLLNGSAYYGTSQQRAVSIQGTSLPAVPEGYADIRCAEVTFTFEPMSANTRVNLWMQAFYVQKASAEDTNYTLYAMMGDDVGHPICTLSAGTEYTARFVFSGSGSARYVHSIELRPAGGATAIYKQTQDGISFSVSGGAAQTAGGRMTTDNGYLLELDNTVSLSPQLMGIYATSVGPTGKYVNANASCPTTSEQATSLTVYSMKYYPYSAGTAGTFAATAQPGAEPGTLAVTVTARDSLGQGETVLVAAYNGDRLVDVQSLTLLKLYDINEAVTLQADSSCTVTVFRWNGLSSLQPVASAVPVIITGA